MASRDFSFTLVSANDLLNVCSFGRMKVYAEASSRNTKVYAEASSRNTNKKWQTYVDKVNGTNPNFNTKFKFVLLQSNIEQDSGPILDVQLYRQRTIGENKHVGQVNIDLKWLFENSSNNPLSMSVKVGDFTSTHGTIQLLYEFGDLKSSDVITEKYKQSYLKEIVEKTALALIVEGAKRVVLATLSA